MPKGFSFFLCMVILQIPLLSVGQIWDYKYTYIGKEDGLPSNTIYSITSDKHGIIWIGTDAGLVKFDGQVRKIWNTSKGLPSNDIFEIYNDSKNRLWLTSFKKEMVYILNDKVYLSFPSHGNNISKFEYGLPRFVEDSNQNTWIVTSPVSLYKIKNDTITKINKNFFNSNGGNLTILNEKLYLTKELSTIVYDSKTDSVSVIYPKRSVLAWSIYINGKKLYYYGFKGKVYSANTSLITEGNLLSRSLNWKLPLIDSSWWLSSSDGIKELPIVAERSPKIFLPGIGVNCIHQSVTNHILLGTNNDGLYLINNKKIKCFRGIQNGNHSFTSIFIQKDLLILGNSVGEINIVSKSGGKNPNFLKIGHESNSAYRIFKILRFQNKFLVVTDVGIFLWNFGSKKFSKILVHHSAIKDCEIDNGEFLILDNDGIRRYDTSSLIRTDSVLPFKRFYSFVKYQKKDIVGSQDSLYYWDKELKPYPLNIPFDYRAMDLDVHDSLLIATTAEKGIFIIKDHTVLKNLNADNGMVTNTCNNTVVYKNILYTATNHGIHIYDIAKDSLSYFFESDGLASNNVSDLAIDADTLYAATENGLSVIPLSVLTPRKPFPCFLQPIYTATDTLWDTPDTIQTRTDQVIFATLNGLSFTSKIPVRFFYRIHEQDTSYRETREQNLELRFDKPGYHTFEAYALNGDLQKSEFVTLTVFVDPYFYQTIWFKILMVLLGIGLLGTTYFVLLYLARKRSKSKHETANKMHVLELTAWRSTVHPHFLFNAMNTMLGLLQNSNFDSANQYIFEFSKMLRKTIDQSGKIMVTIEEEENYLTNYLEFEKAKRNGNLNFEIVIDNTSVRDFFIPSMVIQPILENALKHGLKPRKRGKIRIEFYIKGEFMVAEIRDNGIGFDSELGMAKAGSKGLKLIYDKLNIVEKVLKTKIPLDFKNLTDYKGNITGTQTVFQFPLLNDISHIPGLLPHQDEKANP